MPEARVASGSTRAVGAVAALVIIIFGVNQAQSVVSLCLVAIFLALVGTPAVLWMERKRVPSAVAVLTVMAGMIALLVIIGGVVVASLSTFSEELPQYQLRFQQEILVFRGYLAEQGFTLTDKAIYAYLNPTGIMSLTAGLLTGMGVAISNIVIILLTVTFILLEASSFPTKIRLILGDAEQVFPQVTKFVSDIQQYMVIKTLISLVAGALIGLWLFILGVDFPVLWGFLAFLLHFVPNLGQIIAAIPAILLSLIQLGPGATVMVAAGYLVVGFVLGNIVEPRLMGRQLGLSTLVAFISLVFWGSLLGPIGVVLCIPFTMTVKFACESTPSLRWVAILLGSERPSTPVRGDHRGKRSEHPGGV